ncbi:hypothetical protein Bca52824_007115 [Brassica carinata]|uniref:Uncharacterized protein n=1 Tax=Brassica carinata TaxID=52824 RepID=A0A8X8B7V8_BRACI|nr:hypothetical protein Bca52824_007115 [Brassica carinata]
MPCGSRQLDVKERERDATKSFLWLNIVEVIRNGDELEFSVGITSANFVIEEFYESPQCGCGFDCDGLKSKTENLGRNPFVSSV